MKWIRTALCALGMLACLSLSAFAAELGEPNITEQTTMKELRENPSIKGSGFYTYCNEWIEGSTKYDNTPIKGYVSWAASEDAAEGMNLVIENYNKGVQVTWQVYTPEEIEADPALGMVQLFYFPAKTENAKYVVVVPGNGGNTTAELNEGASIANQLHDLGYAVFVLRYRSFLNASDNAPLYEYTLMPQHMDHAFTAEELRGAQLHPGFSFTQGCPVLQIPVQRGFAYPDLLFDLERDPQQLQPIEDEAVKARMEALLVRLMRENDAPQEQYARLGLKM